MANVFKAPGKEQSARPGGIRMIQVVMAGIALASVAIVADSLRSHFRPLQEPAVRAAIPPAAPALEPRRLTVPPGASTVALWLPLSAIPGAPRSGAYLVKLYRGEGGGVPQWEARIESAAEELELKMPKSAFPANGRYTLVFAGAGIQDRDSPIPIDITLE
ncbi:MAG TPA: hypothetical protein VJ302_37995 [Blastocatellia bacterium]|nr:hypothetical protein [Blastocatellia bacterium]